MAASKSFFLFGSNKNRLFLNLFSDPDADPNHFQSGRHRDDVTNAAAIYHTSHDSVSVVRTTFKVYGKRQSLTLSQLKTPEPIVTKFEWCDNVVDAYHQKIWAQSAQGFLLPI